MGGVQPVIKSWIPGDIIASHAWPGAMLMLAMQVSGTTPIALLGLLACSLSESKVVCCRKIHEDDQETCSLHNGQEQGK